MSIAPKSSTDCEVTRQQVIACCDSGDLASAARALIELAQACAFDCDAAPLRRAFIEAKGRLINLPPSCSYWVGQAFLSDDLGQAREWFLRALSAAQDCKDVRVARAAAVAAMLSYQLGFDDRRGMKETVEMFMRLVPDWPVDAEEDRALLLAGRLCAAYASRDVQLTKQEIDDGVMQMTLDLPRAQLWPSPAMQLAVAAALVDFAGAFVNTERARDVAVATSRLVATCPSALLQALWWIERAWLYANESDGAVFAQCLSKVDALAEHLASDALRFQGLRLRCVVALRQGRTEDGLALLPSFEQITTLSDAAAIELSRLKGAVLILAGRAQEAVDVTEAALRLAKARAAGLSTGTHLIETEHAHALAAVGRLHEAIAIVRALAERDFGAARDRNLALAYAYDWQSSGYKSEAALIEAVRLASRSNAYQLMPRDPHNLALLCDQALRRDIESPFVVELIRRRRLAPPPFACQDWPFQVRVEAMGGFRLSIATRPYKPEHKAQDKVLELLKTLTAAQVLRRGEAERDWLCETLWPDADEPRARKSLESTIARLRRLLQDESAVTVSEGRVRLNPLLVWTDVGAIAGAWARVRDAHDAMIQGKVGREVSVRADVSGLLSLYKGPFLHGDPDQPWVLGARAQLSRLLRQALLTLEQVTGQTKSDFMVLLEQAHAVDPAAEEIAQLLIRHHLADANHTEAMRVYRRTRDTIHAELRTQPSPQTEMLASEVLRAVERDASAAGTVRH